MAILGLAAELLNKSRAVWTQIAATALFSACSLADPQVSVERPPLTDEGRALIASVVGRWQISTNEAGNCDSVWRTDFPSGRTDWQNDAETLTITPLGEGDFLRLYPANENEFEAVISVSHLGCQGISINSLLVDELTERTMNGLFTQEVSITGGSACNSELPAPCHHTTRVQAIRN